MPILSSWVESPSPVSHFEMIPLPSVMKLAVMPKITEIHLIVCFKGFQLRRLILHKREVNVNVYVRFKY